MTEKNHLINFTLHMRKWKKSKKKKDLEFYFFYDKIKNNVQFDETKKIYVKKTRRRAQNAVLKKNAKNVEVTPISQVIYTDEKQIS